jgi:protein TonB
VAEVFEAFTHKQRAKQGRWVSLSALGHAVVVSLLIWRAMVAVHQPPHPSEQRHITFYTPPPPPPPAGGGQHVRPKEPRLKRPDVVQPRPNEITQPQVKDEVPDEGRPGGVVGGVEGGVVGGTIGEFDSRMTPPRLIAGPNIEYTDKALENDVEGLMIVRCILTVVGEVRDCQVKQSVRFMDSTVVETLEKRRYTPVTLAGKPIEVYYTFRIRLNLPR